MNYGNVQEMYLARFSECLPLDWENILICVARLQGTRSKSRLCWEAIAQLREEFLVRTGDFTFGGGVDTRFTPIDPEIGAEIIGDFWANISAFKVTLPQDVVLPSAAVAENTLWQLVKKSDPNLCDDRLLDRLESKH
jgi:hypothetical protein